LLTDLYLDHNDLQGNIPSNFLNASKLASLVILSHNGLLAGTVPANLDSILRLDLQLEGNRISGFPDEFCLKLNWMNGAIGRVGCDAFLCPLGTANPVGRAKDTLKCDDCSSPDGALYYGSTSCDKVSSERQILLLLYQQCGGIEWYRRTGWASDADVSEWIGVSCHDNGDVKSIDLSANNLVGRLPSEIFELPRLESLILSANPISFNFDGIENAQRLTELRLDSTGLSSVEGLAGGLGLTDLNLRFNNLQGTLPQEIFALTNLRLLNLANNKLGSTLPTRIAELKRLRTLRLGSNDFTGPLPPFSHTFILKTIDLSFNDLSGTIPSTFLNRMSSTAKLEVNLASNMLSGGLPVELERFGDLTIYLRDNNIGNIPEVICNNHRWNGGDVEKFGCNAILCAPGTSSKLGRQSAEETPCMVCDSVYYGSTMCSSAPNRRASTTLRGVIASVLVMAVYWI
jgi:Leucine-rich repeat (LRR) protein